MSIPNPLKLKIHGRRNVAIDEVPQEQIGTDLDFMNLYPELKPPDKSESLITLTDSNTIYISDSSGVDTNNGAYATPVKTVNKAVSLATDGSHDDIYFFFFKSTTYTYVENTYIPVKYSFYNDTGVASKYRYILRTAPAGITDANSYFVDFKNGSDFSAGTQTAPVRTLQKCFDLTYATTGVDKNIIILVDDTFTEAEYTTEESCELIFSSSKYRKVYVLWRRAANTFTTGVVAKLKYKYKERVASSLSKIWRGLFYKPGLFLQGGLDAMYACCKNGSNTEIYYSTDGLNYTLAATLTGVSECYDFGYVKISTTNYMFLGTIAGIYRSTNGLTWTVSATVSTGTYQNFIEWNNNLIISGFSGIRRSTDAFATVNTSIDTVNVFWAKPAIVGNYLYYANNSTGVGNIIKRVDSSWTTTNYCTIAEIDNINYLLEFNGSLYCLGYNSTSLIAYFIKIINGSSYEIIYSRDIDTTTYWDDPRTMSVIDDRIYLPDLLGRGKLHAFDGDVFYEIGDIDNSERVFYTLFQFQNRYYYTIFLSTTIKYGLLDCLTVVNDLSIGGNDKIKIYGIAFDGNAKRAAGQIRSKKIHTTYVLNSYVINYCNFYNNYYTAITFEAVSATQELDYCDISNSTNVLGAGGYIRYCLIHNIRGIIFDNFIIPKIQRCIIDFVGEIGGKEISQSILSRVSAIRKDSSQIVKLIGVLIQLPCNIANTVIEDNIGSGAYDKTEFGTPIFRNRDAMNQDFPDYRLQKKWIKTSNGEYYKFNSAGVDYFRYDPWNLHDAGCYFLKRTLYSDTYDYNWEADFNPGFIPFANKFNNINELITVAGIKQASHTADQNVLSIPFRPRTIEEWRTIRDLYTMVRSNEPLRIDLNHWLDYTETDLQTYVKNNDVGVFSGSTVIGGSANWLVKYYHTEKKLVQKEHTWYQDEFKGYLLYLSWVGSSGRQSVWLKIIRNTPTTLYLEDVDGLMPLPGADIDNTSSDNMYYIIGAMYVRCNTKSLETELAMWYRKSNPCIGSLDIELLETP